MVMDTKRRVGVVALLVGGGLQFVSGLMISRITCGLFPCGMLIILYSIIIILAGFILIFSKWTGVVIALFGIFFAILHAKDMISYYNNPYYGEVYLYEFLMVLVGFSLTPIGATLGILAKPLMKSAAWVERRKARAQRCLELGKIRSAIHHYRKIARNSERSGDNVNAMIYEQKADLLETELD